MLVYSYFPSACVYGIPLIPQRNYSSRQKTLPCLIIPLKVMCTISHPCIAFKGTSLAFLTFNYTIIFLDLNSCIKLISYLKCISYLQTNIFLQFKNFQKSYFPILFSFIFFILFISGIFLRIFNVSILYPDLLLLL